MEMIHALYNKISRKYLGPSTTRWLEIRRNGGAVALLRNMEDGLRFAELMRQKHENNDWSSDDYVSRV
jgi:hypothetical protein